MSLKTTKYSFKKKFSKNDFPTLGNISEIKKTNMNYKEKLDQKIKSSNDDLPDGWIRLSTYKPPPKEPPKEYPDLTPTEEFIMMMDIVSKNRINFYRSRMLEPPYVEISPPEYEDIKEDSEESETDDMEDPEYEKIMNKFD